MNTLPAYPLLFLDLREMTDMRAGGASAHDVTADNDFVGRDSQRRDNNVNINFDRASNWDMEREDLTQLQRIRDLETFVFGDRRGLILGILRKMRNYEIWMAMLTALLVINSILLLLIYLSYIGG